MKNLVSLITLIFICMLTALALAADAAPATSTFGDALSSFLTGTAFPILAALALGFVSWAAKKIGTKYHIDSLLSDNNLMTNIAAQGVAFAEEKAANFAKTAQPLTSNDKLNSAIAYVLQMAPKITEAQAQSMVTSVLAMLPGVGATGTAVVVPPITLTPAAPKSTVDPLAVNPA